MAKSKLEKLKTDAVKASRIQQVLDCTGWKDIEEIIYEKYNSLTNELLAKENPEARGGINTITEIMNDISAELNFGKRAKEEYARIYLKQTTKEG